MQEILSFIKLKKIVKEYNGGYQIKKIALLGDSATQFLKISIQGYGLINHIEYNIYESEFNQIERQILDHTSDLYKHEPEIVIIFNSTQKLSSKFSSQNIEKQVNFADNQVSIIENLYENLLLRLNCKVIYFNFTEIDDEVFGNYANKTNHSLVYQIRKINFELMNLAQRLPNLFICDLSSLQNKIGRNQIFSSNTYINSDLVYTLDFYPTIALKTSSIINSLHGKFKKVLILDLDNTLWGGIIGDDGLENIQIGNLGIGKAFSDLQLWAKKLKNRGIILAVCSKNNENIAKEPFEKHPEMSLRLNDFAIFVANWNNKADNIRYIQSILNVGFDSMVFLDDNSFERNLVRQNLPEVVVPELPEDPSEYTEYLSNLNLFDTTSYSNEDNNRNELYQQESERIKLFQSYTNEEEFLKTLGMTSKVEGLTSFNLPRIAQLSQRSNQFNLRTIRYTEEELIKLNESNKYFILAFDLKDKFGEYGLISVVVLKKLNNEEVFIENWLMSCRVLKRGMELFVLNTLIETLIKDKFERLIGEYLPTLKNEMVEKHYESLGFQKSLEINQWKLNISNYCYNKIYIENE